MDVDALAQEIRRVDGSNSLGAGALAEGLMPSIEADTRDLLATIAGLRQKLERVTNDLHANQFVLKNVHEEAQFMRNAAKESRTRAERAEAENARLVEALEPFAKYASENGFGLDYHGNELPDEDGVGWVYLTNGDFRRARATRQATEEKTDG